MKINIWITGAVLALTGCASVGERDTLVGQPGLELAAPAGVSVKVIVPPGEAVIEGVSGNQVKAEMEIHCAADDDGCANRFSDTEWSAQITNDHLVLKPSRDSLYSYRDADVTTRIWIPADRPLEVDMDAGNLKLLRVSGCLTVNMDAGDITVETAASGVGSAHLDANFGDVSLDAGSGWIDGNRKLLVGAEVEWDSGAGECHLSVDLQFGDVEVTLY